MYRSRNYPTADAAVDAFVAGQRHGQLIATPANGFPQVSILPFVLRGDTIELHCVREDPTFIAAQANPLVTFLVADFLAFSPHDWVSLSDAGRATLHFRAVQFRCEATTSTDPEEVAAALRGLLASYEPDASYTPIVDGEFYGPRLRRLGAVRLRILEREAKFKAGPAAPVAVKRAVAAKLRERGHPLDGHAADVIESYLPR